MFSVWTIIKMPDPISYAYAYTYRLTVRFTTYNVPNKPQYSNVISQTQRT